MGQKLKCLVEQVTWVQVEPLFIEYYGHYFNKFKKRIKKKKIKRFAAIFEQLKVAYSEETSWRVKISKTRHEGAFFIDVSGLDGTLYREQDDFDFNLHGEYADKEVPFSLIFIPWRIWLGMRVEQSTLVFFSYEEILAHCLWEMTYYHNSIEDSC
ncbi:hypothetical protein J8M20_08610 [Pseudoalteromonas luteoviolacea]|uniref:DUF6557 family protein n=1 Tax=Pseudoalteromonas luteoviolacea TaxID=43657 RepID=UPI001B38BE3D|nr:DUF6557 family protein [Pseudoalteromonas luteoviolacea]MBQ4811396.1 hypothetical protein [Pseudoalteromonas luteoviolacea]